MKNKILTLIVLFYCFFAYSQSNKCVIYFNDTTKVEGLCKLKTNGEVKFIKNKGDKKTLFYHSQISKVEIIDDEITTYEYKYIDEYSSEWLELLIKGEVSLYTTSISSYHMNNSLNTGGMNGMTFGGGTTTYYYTCRQNENGVFRIASKGTISRSFKKTASEYFKDCPEIVEKIQSKDYKKDDIEEIVRIYNKSDCPKIKTE